MPRLGLFLLPLAAFLLVYNLVWLAVWADPRGPLDLASFIHSGNSYNAGANPYNIHNGIEPRVVAINYNPPVSLQAFRYLGRFDGMELKDALTGTSLLVYGGIVALLARAYPGRILPLLAAPGLAGLWHTLGFGQIYMPIIACVVGSWLALRSGNDLLAAVLIGVAIALKPNFAVWALLLLAAGYPRIFWVSGAVAVAISAVPLVLDGPAIYVRWLRVLLDVHPGNVWWHGNGSLFAAVHLGASMGALKLAGLGLIVAATVWARWTRPSTLDASAVAFAVVLLIGPMSWPGYQLIVLPILFAWRWNPVLWLAVVLLSVPMRIEEPGVYALGVLAFSAAAAWRDALVPILERVHNGFVTLSVSGRTEGLPVRR